jgi:hypothetical protein
LSSRPKDEAWSKEGFEDLPATEWRGAAQEQRWLGFQGHFRTTNEIDRFVEALKT